MVMTNLCTCIILQYSNSNVENDAPCVTVSNNRADTQVQSFTPCLTATRHPGINVTEVETAWYANIGHKVIFPKHRIGIPACLLLR